MCALFLTELNGNSLQIILCLERKETSEIYSLTEDCHPQNLSLKPSGFHHLFVCCERVNSLCSPGWPLADELPASAGVSGLSHLPSFQMIFSDLGACTELCRGDWDCAQGDQCVSTGCGQVCVTS